LLQAVIRFMEDKDRWEGTAGELFEKLTSNWSASFGKDQDWPKSEIALGKRLSPLLPALSGYGITINRDGRTKQQRLIVITKK
jgi:hypothetical protein